MAFKDRLMLTMKYCRDGSGTVALCAAICVSVGVSISYLIFPGTVPHLLENEVPPRLRNHQLTATVLSTICTALAYVAAAIWVRFVRRSGSPIDALRKINGFAVFALCLPALVFLQSKNVSSDSYILSLTVIMIATAAAMSVFARIYTHAGGVPFFSADKRSVAIVVIALLSIVHAVLAGRFQLIRIANSDAGVWDLGYYVNTLWNTIHGRLMRCTFLDPPSHITAHFDPIIILISPIMLIHEGPETAVIFQNLWMTIGVIPAFLLGVHHTGKNWFGMVMAVVYLMNPALQGALLSDFHSLALSTPLFLWLFYCMEKERWVAYGAVGALLMTTREDTAVLLAATGMYMVLAKQRWRRPAIATIAVSLTYLAVVKFIVLAHSKHYASYYDGLEIPGLSLGESFVTIILTNPGYLLTYMFSEKKVLFFLVMLQPMLGLPLLSGKMRWLFVYGVFVILLVNRIGVYSIGQHYIVWLYPFFIASLPAGIAYVVDHRLAAFFRWNRDKMRAVLAFGMLFSTILVSIYFGMTCPNPNFKAGYFHMQWSLTRKAARQDAAIKEALQIVPKDAVIGVTLRSGLRFSTRPNALYVGNKLDYEEIDYVLTTKKEIKSKKNKHFFHRSEFLKSKSYKHLIDKDGIVLFKNVHRAK